MEMPAVKLLAIGNDMYLAVKALGGRVAIDIRQFKSYKDGGKEYPTNVGIFLYLDQYRKAIALCKENREEFFAIPGPPMPAESPLEPNEPFDLGYGAYLARSDIGQITITIVTKQCHRSISLRGENIAAIFGHNDKIERSIGDFSFNNGNLLTLIRGLHEIDNSD